MFSGQAEPEGEEEKPNELAIDENMDLVERVKAYCKSSISVQRLVHVRELSSCAEQIGAEETLTQLLPLLAIISSDVEISVRQALAEQMVAFCKVLLDSPEVAHTLAEGTEPQTAYEIVVFQCVPVLSKLLSGGSSNDPTPPGGAQLCDAAAEALVELAGLLKPHDVGHTVLTAVLCLAHDNEVEENRVVATQLLGALASTVGRELCCQFVLPEIISLADDPVFRVRKAAALKVGSLCHVVGEQLSVQRLLPVFEVLSRDEIWGVRKASVESLAEVAAVMPLEVRTGKLVELFRDFHEDGSRWVRIAACQALGPFLATLPSENISADLLALFTQLATPSNANAVDSDIGYYCAFNFPGVAQAVGPSRWGELTEAFLTLSSNIQWKVRRTLSYSLHALARVLGRQLTTEHLLPTFERFLKDLDEVKVGAVQHLCSFLAVLDDEARLRYLPTLSEIRSETDNWRFRHMLALQLADFGGIFPLADIQNTLTPLALDLCTDQVAEVRIAAISQVGELLSLLLRAEAAGAAGGAEAAGAAGADCLPTASFVGMICDMASMQSCHKRANFVHICASLVHGLPPQHALVTSQLLPCLERLVTDRVANVRLPLAELVVAELLPHEAYAVMPSVQRMVEQLLLDSDRDVLRAVSEEGFEPPPYRCKQPPVTPTPPATEPATANSAAAADGAGQAGEGAAGQVEVAPVAPVEFRAAATVIEALGPRDAEAASGGQGTEETRLPGDTDAAAEILLNEALMMTALNAAGEGPEPVE